MLGFVSGCPSDREGCAVKVTVGRESEPRVGSSFPFSSGAGRQFWQHGLLPGGTAIKAHADHISAASPT